ncbi:MAG: HEPN domain-containing protein [Isosphaeraceae bacterium]
MPSNAFTVHLEQLLLDAVELDDAHTELRTGNPGRQYGLASLNRAIVVMSVSAWESYVEELMRESLLALRPPGPPFAAPWPALDTYVTGQLGRFHTPSQHNVEQLIRNCLGLNDVHLMWTWQNCTSAQAVQRLEDAMVYRHQIAHGVNPRPVIHNYYSSQLPSFFRRLARCTDLAVRDHMVGDHGLANPWPI